MDKLAVRTNAERDWVGRVAIPQPQHAALVAGWYEKMSADDFAALGRFDRLERGKGLPGRIWQSKEPAWIPELERDPNFPRASLARSIGLQSAFGFPLIVSGEVSAVIEFFSREPRSMEESTLKTAAILGSHIGQFIEREAAEEFTGLS